MSYEKVNPILEGLKIDEAGIRDIKETGKILSEINAKLKETNNVKLLQEILKYVTNEVDKDTSGTFTVANKTFHLPLLKYEEGNELYKCIDKLVEQKIYDKVKSLLQKKFGKGLIVRKKCEEHSSYFNNYNISPVTVKYVRVIIITFDFKVQQEEFDAVKKEINSLVENIFRKEMPGIYKNKFIRKTHSVPDIDSDLYVSYEIPEFW